MPRGKKVMVVTLVPASGKGRTCYVTRVNRQKFQDLKKTTWNKYNPETRKHEPFKIKEVKGGY